MNSNKRLDKLLTKREYEVAACVAAGQSNMAIAESLVIEVRTVERHIGSVFEKLKLDRVRYHARTALALRYWQDIGYLDMNLKIRFVELRLKFHDNLLFDYEVIN